MALVGYIANVLAVPPMVFKFQLNPTVISEKRTYEYQEVEQLGKAMLDKAGAAKGFFGTIAGFGEDVKEWGSLLTDTKPLQPNTHGGKPRVFELEFVLDAKWTDDNGETRWGEERIDLDLQILRSFVNPGIVLTDLGDVFGGKLNEAWKPPEVSFKYGPISMTGVMTDLNIKIVSFLDDGSPWRAEITCIIKEQSKSYSAVVQTAKRLLDTSEAALKTSLGDIAAASPIGFLFD